MITRAILHLVLIHQNMAKMTKTEAAFSCSAARLHNGTIESNALGNEKLRKLMTNFFIQDWENLIMCQLNFLLSLIIGKKGIS